LEEPWGILTETAVVVCGKSGLNGTCQGGDEEETLLEGAVLALS